MAQTTSEIVEEAIQENQAAEYHERVQQSEGGPTMREQLSPEELRAQDQAGGKKDGCFTTEEGCPPMMAEGRQLLIAVILVSLLVWVSYALAYATTPVSEEDQAREVAYDEHLAKEKAAKAAEIEANGGVDITDPNLGEGHMIESVFFIISATCTLFGIFSIMGGGGSETVAPANGASTEQTGNPSAAAPGAPGSPLSEV